MSKTVTSKISLSSVLCNEVDPPYSLNDFRNFLKKEHSEENLEFWQAIVEYRRKAYPHFPKYGKTSSHGNMAESTSNSQLSNEKLAQKDEMAQELREQLKNDLELIITLYLTPGGTREVNLGDQVRKKIVRDVLERKVYHPDVLKHAAEKTFDLMRLDSFSRFVQHANREASAQGRTAQVEREGGGRSALNALQKQSQQERSKARAEAI